MNNPSKRVQQPEYIICTKTHNIKTLQRHRPEEILYKADGRGSAYNRVYKTIYARMKRGTLTADEFNRWKAEARLMLDKTRAGEIRENVFEAWLKQDIRAWGIGRAVVEQRAPKLGED